jgi:two-component system, OmpR family, sensor histidine kinase MprB
MSLRWRIALSLATVAAVVGALAAGGAYVATAKQIKTSIDTSLRTKGLELAGFGGGDGNRPGGRGKGPGQDDRHGCPQPAIFEGAVGAQIAELDGTRTSCYLGATNELPFTSADAASTAKSPVLRTVRIGRGEYRLVTVPWHEGGYIQMIRPLDEGHEILESLIGKLLALSLGGMCLAALLGWFLAERVVRPIIHLRDTAETIATTQDLGTPIQTNATGEVGSLAKSFTTMVSALAGSREQQKRLITDASHEMRTPLTSLRTNIELMEHFERLDPADRHAVLTAVQVDAGELTHLLTELVELATDQTSNDEAPEPVRLADLATDVITRAIRRSGRQIVLHANDPNVTVSGRPAMLERAISNLVENAVKYSPSTTQIDVNIDGAQLAVRDHGPGIPVEDQPFVFDRFYRATITRTEPGSGLGLAIVKQIVDRHRGRVWAQNHPGGGAIVGFALP